MSHPSSPVAGRHWLGCSAATKRWKTCRKLWRSRVRPWDAVELWPWMAMDHPQGKSIPSPPSPPRGLEECFFAFHTPWTLCRAFGLRPLDISKGNLCSHGSWPIAMIAMVAFIFPGLFWSNISSIVRWFAQSFRCHLWLPEGMGSENGSSNKATLGF